jgi:hypothetical protein
LQAGSGLAQIKSLSFIAPHGFAQFFADHNPGADHLEIMLPAANATFALFDGTGSALTQVSYGAQTPGVAEGRLPDGTGVPTGFPTSASPGASNYLISWNGPILNEIFARNEGAAPDSRGRWVGWIEFANPAAEAFDLAGMSISVGTRQPRQWVFPIGSIVPANGFLVLWCDSSRPPSTTLMDEMNIGRDLASDSSGVWLFDPSDREVDALEYGHQISNMTIGKTAGQWRLLASPTVGAANSVPAALGSPSALRINEWMAAPAAGEDWVELHNTSALPVDMGGCYLTDDPSLTGQTNTQLRAHSFIAPGGFTLVIASGDALLGANHTNFKIDRQGDALRIYTSTKEQIDAVDFGPAIVGVSRGRYPDGAAALMSFGGTASPGAANYLDSDGDGLPDAWEIANGLDPFASDADLDSDNDGRTNLDEFAAGTDPQSAASLFIAESSTKVPGTILIRFMAEPNRTYSVEFKDTLSEGSWSKLLDVPGALTQREVQVGDKISGNASRFYRVITPRAP